MTLNIHLLDAPDPEDLADLKARLNGDIRVTVGPYLPADCHILVAGRPYVERDQVILYDEG